MRILILILLMNCTVLLAQTEQNNWYFGRFAAISFTGGAAQPKFDNPQNSYGSTASISNPTTGNLLFYTNGQKMWNKNHVTMPNGNGPFASATSDVMIVPMPFNNNKYYVFFMGEVSSLMYVIVDMSLDNGNGDVITTPRAISTNNLKTICVVNHLYNNAFWVITHEVNSNKFKAHYIDSTGVSSLIITSEIGIIPTIYGDMVASNQGNKLAVTHYQKDQSSVEVFDFDNVCGKVSNQVILPKQNDWDYPYGIAFSPNDSNLYITYSYMQSQLIQYSGNNYQTNYTIATSPSNFNKLRLGIDNKIYITTHDNGIPGKRINAILNPDELSNLCQYRETFFVLDEGTGKNRIANFELPHFTTGKKISSVVNDNVISITGQCLGDTTAFTFNNNLPYDSILWRINDNGYYYGNNTTIQHVFKHAGKHAILITIYKCGNKFLLADSIKIDDTPEINFATDTTICANQKITLTGTVAQSYTWSTNETTQQITTQDTGLVWLKATNNNCTAIDSINILNHPNIITALGSEYFICEDDLELVKLDAGEGFTDYKWTPTNDTSQWIIVKQTGEYFVKVIDNFGCYGDGNTKVKRRCDALLYFPNIFTPNNDGENDIYLPKGQDVTKFEIKIYNRWGQLVFNGNNVHNGWDGNFDNQFATNGVYIFEATYEGYIRKKKKQFTQKGTITLLR